MSPFSAIFIPDELMQALSDRAWLDAMLEAELALVNAEALAGVIGAGAAAAVADACAAGLYDAKELAREGRAAGNPVEPLVRALRERVGTLHADAVHRGATSQDILDSAAMLVTRNALRLFGADLDRVAARCAVLAEEHRSTLMPARTLLQQAVPTTFGFKVAAWLLGVVESQRRLQNVADSLPAQLGGAAGTLAALGDPGLEVLKLYAAELDLREPTIPWHTVRIPIADLAGSLATAAGILGKISNDIVLLAQTEVAEVSEGASGVSSTMPHKRNAAAAVLAGACVRHATANTGILFASLVQEHERAAGAWHSEWHALNTALAATGGAANAVARSLEGLEVDAARMRSNLTDETLAEAARLGFAVDRPEDYLGAAATFIDRVLTVYRS